MSRRRGCGAPRTSGVRAEIVRSDLTVPAPSRLRSARGKPLARASHCLGTRTPSAVTERHTAPFACLRAPHKSIGSPGASGDGAVRMPDDERCRRAVGGERHEWLRGRPLGRVGVRVALPASTQSRDLHPWPGPSSTPWPRLPARNAAQPRPGGVCRRVCPSQGGVGGLLPGRGHRGAGLLDESDHGLRLRHVDRMAAGDLDHG